MKGYYFITNSRLSRSGNISDVKSAVSAGAPLVQYRYKTSDPEEMFEEAFALRKICRKTRFLLNDRVEIALMAGADGVHLGQGDISCASARKLLGKGKIIGVTVRTVRQAVGAWKNGADYVAVGPVFKTGTKLDAGTPVGVSMVKKVRKAVPIPVAAIGGITLENAPAVIEAGADLICAISPVVTKRDVKSEILKFQALFRAHSK